ncbi:transporter [Novosphingobium sp.]|jgi:hypothetical protein|uniref:transporter n=1 Tax=Novosphingobium sp. TaxID=1874826 RepID=UPI002FE0A1E0
MQLRLILLAIMIAGPTSALAQDRDYCPDRPGIGTPACTMDPGRFSLETGLGDWTVNRDSSQREDSVVLGDFLLRMGVADHAEVQVGWTSLGFVRTRDRESGHVDHRTGTGDMTLALRRNLVNPDGSGFSAAMMPFVSLPTGGAAIGAGDWGGGVRIPLSYELTSAVSLEAVPEFDADVDEDRHGRHFTFSDVVGVSVKLAEAITATAEYQFSAVREKGDHHLEHVSGLSLAWQTSDNFQVDLGANAGLDRDSDDLQVYLGVSRRF